MTLCDLCGVYRNDTKINYSLLDALDVNTVSVQAIIIESG